LCFPRPQWAAAIGLAAGVPPTTFDDARVGDAQRAKRAVASLVELRGPLGFRFEVHLGPPALVLRDYLRSCTPLMVVVARDKRLGGDGLVRAVRTVIARQSSRPALVLA
jgi:hypothetical protein